MEKDLKEKCRKIVSELKKGSDAELVNYDIKTDFSEEISEGVNTEWNKCNENLSEGNKLRNADFKFDSLEPWEKICCYKIAPDTFDCDVSLRNMVIYGIIFPFVLESRKLELQKKNKLKYCFHSDDDKIFEYRGDTMNSYATTVHKWILSYSNHSKSVKKFLSDIDWGKYKKYKWEAYILDNYKYFKNILPAEAKAFIRLNHTMGNFIPCPAGCNSPRGTNFMICDYWDLTLYYIYKWYRDKSSDIYLYTIVKEKSKVEQYKEWLEEFGRWDMFVEKNYMQAFVNDGNDGHKYGMPKELWKGHFTGNPMPEKDDDFSQFFTNASAWIVARGTRIAIELRKKLDKENVSEIVNKLLGNDEG